MVALALSPSAAGPPTRCHYQAQDSRQTLAEGLAEYYAKNRGRVARPETLAPESAELFRGHDMCHVIFGLDTTLDDEGMADLRTLLSCDVGWRRYARYVTSDPEAKAVFRQLGYAKAVWTTIRVVPRLLRAVAETARMHRRWPWTPPEEFQHRTLTDLRREFGIRVI
jgi:hypothetical protein